MATRELISDAKAREFYNQARAGAPTDTDTVALGRSPGFGLPCLYREYTWKGGFLGRGTSD